MTAARSSAPTARAIHLAGGLHHPTEASSAFWASLWERLNIEAMTFEDIDEGCRALAAQPCDLLVVSALRWPMDGDAKYEPHRARWAYRVSDETRETVQAHLSRGGALLGVHAASISFTDWPQWRRMLGGAWIWGRSSHPPFGAARVQVSDQAHSILSGVQDFDVLDEVYGGLEIDAHCQVLMHARAEDGPWMPCWWVHQYGPARVCYDALGHDERSLSAASHQRALEQSIAWLLGRTTAQTY